MDDLCVVRSEVSETGFGFYTDDELEELSCCKITSTLAIDPLGVHLFGGLYDPKMGPLDNQSTCVTCHQSSINCPGHFGHIELNVPVS